MVWGGFGAGGVDVLDVIEGTMTGAIYVDILRRNLELSVAFTGFGSDFIFQQDNDPKHISRVAEQYFTCTSIRILDWPAQSKDLLQILLSIFRMSLMANLQRKIENGKVQPDFRLETRMVKQGLR